MASQSVILRPYAPEDRPRLLALQQELHAHELAQRPQRSRAADVSDRYFRLEYVAHMADPDCDCMFLVAENAGTLVGLVFCLVDGDILDDPAEQVHVMDLAVTRSHRRQGVARRLMAEVDRFAQARGIARITVTALAVNSMALTFYRALGFDTAFVSLERTLPSPQRQAGPPDG